MAKSSRYFPEEVIFQTLSWTKVTSLLRFKSVCKLWRSIISKPKFIQAHHPNSLESPSLLIITSRAADFDEQQGNNHLAATIFYSDDLRVSLPLPCVFDKMKFVSSCNGIVCVCDISGDTIYLFNPLTRMSKELPPVVNNQKPFKFDVVFGFDCVSHDFKVLRIKYQKDDNSQLVSVFLVELYTSNADSWREIGVSLTLPSFVYHPLCPVLISGPVLDGVLYLEGMNEIVTFDLRDELFGLIPFPDFMKVRKSNVLDVDGSVAVVVETFGDGSVDKEISLWTVETILDEVFWSKIKF